MGSGFIEPGEFVSEKIRLKIFGMRNVFFLRDRAAFLVGVSKHGSRIGDGRKPIAAAYQTRLNPYGCHRQFQPKVRSSIRVESRNARLFPRPPSATEDRDSTEPNQQSDRFLDPWDTDYNEPASGRPEWSCRWQCRCNDRRHQRYFSRYGFPCCHLSPLEVLRQTFCRLFCADFKPSLRDLGAEVLEKSAVKLRDS